MPDPLETSDYATSASHHELKSSLLERQTPLTTEEISLIKIEGKNVNSDKINKYQLGDKSVSITFRPIYIDRFEDEQHQQQVLEVLKRRQDGEALFMKRANIPLEI